MNDHKAQGGDDAESAVYAEDPFSRQALPHPALGDAHDLSTDVYRPLFDWFFQSEVFERWVQRKTSRQLYCTGGPGSGKTTLTALTAAQILERSAASGDSNTFVATVYVQSDITGSGQAFLEDFLRSIYVQLAPLGVAVTLPTLASYEAYSEAQRAGMRASVRIDSIAKAVHARLSELKDHGRAFLLVDSMDRCTRSLQELLERELDAMQRIGLSIMVASRLPIYESKAEVYCDIHEKDEYEAPLEFYWRCLHCGKTIICIPDKEAGKLCNNCKDDTNWSEPKHFDMPIDRVPSSSLQDFVAWDLEKEHGDLGLGSDYSNKPPLSALGLSFQDAEAGLAAGDWVERIAEEAHGSIALAKLGLDRVHRAMAVDAIEFAPPDRLPRNVLAIFDEGLKSIQRQPDEQRDLALKTIAAVAKDGLSNVSTPVSYLAKVLRERAHTPGQRRVPPRSIEDLLQAAKGYLRLEPPWFDDDEYSIAAYNFPLALYASQGYNDELVWANAQLRTSHIPRSLTRALPKPDEGGKMERSREDVLGDLKRFHAQSPSPLRSSGSPLGRHTSPLLRSNTGIAPDVLRRRARPIGLGLDI